MLPGLSSSLDLWKNPQPMYFCVPHFTKSQHHVNSTVMYYFQLSLNSDSFETHQPQIFLFSFFLGRENASDSHKLEAWVDEILLFRLSQCKEGLSLTVLLSTSTASSSTGCVCYLSFLGRFPAPNYIL